MRMSRVLAALALTAGVGMAGAVSASADQPPKTNCWGVVSAQGAQSSGGLGEHSSSFAGEPRLGLGNVARAFGLAGPGELGSVLATLDMDDATTC
jgi:opacity protein-like surface antigen